MFFLSLINWTKEQTFFMSVFTLVEYFSRSHPSVRCFPAVCFCWMVAGATERRERHQPASAEAPRFNRRVPVSEKQKETSSSSSSSLRLLAHSSPPFITPPSIYCSVVFLTHYSIYFSAAHIIACPSSSCKFPIVVTPTHSHSFTCQVPLRLAQWAAAEMSCHDNTTGKQGWGDKAAEDATR